MVWNNWLILFPSHWECHYPNWRTHIFQRDRYTTNQWLVGGWSTTLWTIGNDHSSYDSWIIHDVWQFLLFNVRPSHSNLTAPRNHGGCMGWNHIFGIIEWGHVICLRHHRMRACYMFNMILDDGIKLLKWGVWSQRRAMERLSKLIWDTPLRWRRKRELGEGRHAPIKGWAHGPVRVSNFAAGTTYL